MAYCRSAVQKTCMGLKQDKGEVPHETVVPGTAKPWPDSGWMGGTWRPLEHNQYHRGVPSPP